MDFNLFVILAAVAVGTLSGVFAVRGKDLFSAFSVLQAIGAGAILTIGVSIVTLLSPNGNLFALAHVLYTIGTIGIPIAALIMLFRASEAPKVIRGFLALATLAAPLGIYATYIEPFWLRVDRAVVLSTPETAGPRIGVLSDLQTPHIGDYESRAIGTLLDEKPDIILIPGDFWQMSPEEFEFRKPEFIAAMARLDAGAPYVIAVNGNTDNVDGLRELTAGTSILVLDNEVVEVDVNGVRVRVGGISLAGDDTKRPAVISELATGDSAVVRILLAHQPDEINLIPAGVPIDLIVAGHTHGGQIQIPFFGPPFTLTSVPRDVAAGGLHTLDGYPIYVSTGVGRERFRAPQVRFGARPSVGIIDFSTTAS